MIRMPFFCTSWLHHVLQEPVTTQLRNLVAAKSVSHFHGEKQIVELPSRELTYPTLGKEMIFKIDFFQGIW